jgi:hypothetical protein
MKYVDTSAVLRLLFSEPGETVPLTEDDRLVSSQLLEVEAFRASARPRWLLASRRPFGVRASC